MAKKIWILACLFLIFIAAAGVAGMRWFTKDTAGEDFVSNTAIQNNAGNANLGTPQTQGHLGKHECLALFQVKRGQEQSAGQEILTAESFTSFRSGAFSGKIKDFQPGQNQQFAAFINQMMQEDKIATYLHLQADVCLYYQDLLNPENGANLDYYVEHYYCTNSCQTGKYDIGVNLDADGNFVGYRRTENIY